MNFHDMLVKSVFYRFYFVFFLENGQNWNIVNEKLVTRFRRGTDGGAEKKREHPSHGLCTCRCRTLTVHEEGITEKIRKRKALPYMLRNPDDFSASMARN